MASYNLQGVADEVVRRAERQGSVLPREVREELSRAGLPEELWKDVLALGRAALTYRKGRYHYTAPVSRRAQADRTQRDDLRSVVRHLIEQHRSAARQVERREADRVDFIHPVQVVTEGGDEWTQLSRDLSPTGIRLIGTRRLLGQKIRVRIPSPAGQPQEFSVRIVWTAQVGDDLVENGGVFLEVGGK